MYVLKMENQPEPSLHSLVRAFLDQMMTNYWGPIWHFVKDNPELKASITGFLIEPKKVTVYIGKTHIGIEYHGSEVPVEFTSESRLEIHYRDCTDDDTNLMEKIIGFSFDSSGKMKEYPLQPINEGLVFPTNRGFDKLHELGWNFAAQNSILGFNIPAPLAMPGEPVRIINGIFFDSNEAGLITRHIKWLDLFPITFDESDDTVDTIGFNIEPLKRMVEHDAKYRYPMSDYYKFQKLPLINRFIETWGTRNSSEPQITAFLSEDAHKFILTMRFGAVDVFPQLKCDWQSETRDSIQPDFFIKHSNGFADIVEFKLPSIKGNPVVGINNRESFASWLNSYISQARVYSLFFEDPNNRTWFESRYGFKVYKPRRWLVVGRRSDFDPTLWREIISDYRDLEIITYDDLIDGVVAQFYK